MERSRHDDEAILAASGAADHGHIVETLSRIAGAPRDLVPDVQFLGRQGVTVHPFEDDPLHQGDRWTVAELRVDGELVQRRRVAELGWLVELAHWLSPSPSGSFPYFSLTYCARLLVGAFLRFRPS